MAAAYREQADALIEGGVFRLLEPEKNIGVRLTKQFHLEAEQAPTPSSSTTRRPSISWCNRMHSTQRPVVAK